MFIPRFIVLIFLACLTLLHAPIASSVVLDPVLDRHWVRDSDFIFMGTVKAIDYKMSTVLDKEEGPIPHTFVTFAIQRILKGTTADPQIITLRFQGGRGEKSAFLMVGGVPLFDLEDQGIFYVRGNGTQACPLVGWRQGWSRIINKEIYSNFGEEILLSNDPVLAARIHPRDIRNYDALFLALQKPERMIDRILWEALQPETRMLIQNPDSIREINPDALQFLFPEKLLIDEKADPSLFDKLMPIPFRTVPRNLSHILLYRDLNLLLLQRNFFNPNNTGDLDLRGQTRELLAQNQRELPLEAILLLNRRVLEDAYPDLLTKSLDQTIVPGKWTMLDEVMTHTVSETTTKMIMTEPKGEVIEPDPDPLPEGTRLSVDTYLSHIDAMVKELHTEAELKQLPPVLSANIQESFTVRPLLPLQAGLDLNASPRVPTDEEGKTELNYFLRSGGNPVVKQ